MKHSKTFIVALLCTILMIAPALSGKNYVSAYVVSEEEEVEETDPTILEQVAIGTLVLGVVEKLFCPKTPQNRCKNHVCKPGACISFREACSGDGAC